MRFRLAQDFFDVVIFETFELYSIPESHPNRKMKLPV